MRGCLALVDRGVSLDVALSLDDDERAAWLIIFGQIRGHEFDWANGMWKER